MSFTLVLLYMLKWFDAFDKAWMVWIFAGYLLVCVIGVLAVFKKAGKPVWHALIPFYGSWELFSIAWDGRMGIIFRALTIAIFLLLPNSIHLFYEGTWGMLCFFCLVACIVLKAVLASKMGFSFGHGPAFSYLLFFAEGIGFLILGFDKSEYLGPTLVRSEYITAAHGKIVSQCVKSVRRYTLNLQRWRSIIALAACLVTVIFSVSAINWGQFFFLEKGTPVPLLFSYFTILSNCLTTIASGMVIPYAIDGINHKRLTYPRWIALFHYAATICTTLTMTFAVLIISWFNADFAFGRYNFFLHLVCPIAVLIAFFMVESDYTYSMTDMFICMIPFFVYAMLYLVNVVLIGQENGGWEDIYYLSTYTPVTLSVPLMFFLALIVAFLIRIGHNKLTMFRRKRMLTGWSDEMTAVEIKIEIYGLGRYEGKHGHSTNIPIPLDIFILLSKKYSLPMNDLIRVYSKAVVSGLMEREHHDALANKKMVEILGTPQSKVKNVSWTGRHDGRAPQDGGFQDSAGGD